MTQETTPASDPKLLSKQEMRDAILNAHQMATANYAQSDTEMRRRIGLVLERAVDADDVMRGLLGRGGPCADRDILGHGAAGHPLSDPPAASAADTPASAPRLDEWEKLAGTYFKIDRINYCLDDVDDLANWAAAAREAIPQLIAMVRERERERDGLLRVVTDNYEAYCAAEAAEARATAAEAKVVGLDSPEALRRLQDAVEEECDGLAIDEAQGRSIRDYFLGRAET